MKFYGSERIQQILTYLKNIIATKQDRLTFDSTPTQDSMNPVRSGGIFNALATKIDGSGLATVATTGEYADLNGKPTIDSALSDSSTNAVQNKVVNTALAGKVDNNDSRLSDARTPVAHTHPASDITGIPSFTWTRFFNETGDQGISSSRVIENNLPPSNTKEVLIRIQIMTPESEYLPNAHIDYMEGIIQDFQSFRSWGSSGLTHVPIRRFEIGTGNLTTGHGAVFEFQMSSNQWVCTIFGNYGSARLDDIGFPYELSMYYR